MIMVSISRDIAYRALAQWTGDFGDPQAILEKLIPVDIKAEDSAFARELFFGVIKYQRKLDYISSKFLSAKKIGRKLNQIIRLGVYQLLQTPNIPEYAVVSESGDLAHKYFARRQAGFINAVLRNIIRKKDNIKLPDKDNSPVEYLGVIYSYPDWLIERYIDRFGFDQTEQFLDWCNKPPALSFFINKYSGNERETIEKLQGESIPVTANEVFDGFYLTSEPHRLINSQIFKSGRIIISDAAQGLSPKALNPEPGTTTLDLFAAPGSKTAALSGMIGAGGMVIASDNNIKRIKLMRSNIRRWQTGNVFLISSSALQFASRRNFRYILADVPCSGTGTMRRNPDLRWKLKPDEIRHQASKQSYFIQAAASMLKTGGRLVYSTCSIEPEENGQIVKKFLKHNPGFRLKAVDDLKRFEEQSGIYSAMPHIHHSDGAFVAVIERG